MKMQKIKYTKQMGDNIRKIRLAQHMTQDDVAKELQLAGYDISLGYYAKYERAELNIRPDVLLGLTKIFQCDLMEFFKDIEVQK